MKEYLRQVWKKITGVPGFVGRLLVVLFVLALMIGAMILSGPKPGGDFDPLATPTSAPVTLESTAIATERPLSTEYGLTDGVILAVVTVVFVVGVGTVLHLRKDRKEK